MRRRVLLALMAIVARSDSLLHHQAHVSASLSSSSRRARREAPRSLAVGRSDRGRGAAADASKGLLREKQQRRGGPNTHREAAERTVVLLYHKPRDVVTSHNAANDPLGRRTVYDDVRSMDGYVTSTDKTSIPRSASPPSPFQPSVRPVTSFHEATKIGPNTKLHAVGRLDAETTGLLLLTNDGGLVHHVTHSKHDEENEGVHHGRAVVIDKTYEAVIMGHHDESSSVLATVRRGVDLGPKGGGRTRPPHNLLVLGHPTRTTTLVSITISEGKNRQVRRMFHAAGSGVMHLTRVRIGPHLTLEGLEEEGSWRVLSEDEVRDKLHWAPRVLVGTSSSSVVRGRKREGKRAPRTRERQKHRANEARLGSPRRSQQLRLENEPYVIDGRTARQFKVVPDPAALTALPIRAFFL